MADWPPLKNAAFTVTFPIYDADGDLVTAAASLDSEVSKDGGDFTDVTPGEAAEINTSSGVYKLALTATEMNADIVATITKTGTAGAKTAVNVMYTVTRQLKDVAFPNVSGRGMDIDASGGAEVGAFQAGAITAAAFAVGAVDANALAADAATEIRSLVSGTADSGSTTTMVDAARTEADTDYWKGSWILFTSGNISGQCRLITAFDVALDQITFTPATTQAVSTQTYEILPAARGDAALWLGVAVNALQSGRVDASVGAMAADTLTAAAIAADAAPELRGALTQADTDYWKGCLILFTSGTISGQVRLITAFDPALDQITFSPATTQAVGVNTYEILPAGRADVALWLGAAVNALQSGRVDAFVGAFASAVIASGAFASSAIDAAALATDAVNKIADGIMTRASSNWEATAPVKSLGAAVMKAVHRIRDNAGALEIYRSNGTTIHASQTITTDAANQPIDELTGAV